jgi:hypothetical protein
VPAKCSPTSSPTLALPDDGSRRDAGNGSAPGARWGVLEDGYALPWRAGSCGDGPGARPLPQ